MALLSISQAARTAGVSRQTLHTYIKQGKLTTQQDNDGNPLLDTSDLLRVCGAFKIDSKILTPVLHALTPDLQADNGLLRAELTSARELLREKEQTIRAKDQTIEVQAQALRLLEHRTVEVVVDQDQPSWIVRILTHKIW